MGLQNFIKMCRKLLSNYCIRGESCNQALNMVFFAFKTCLKNLMGKGSLLQLILFFGTCVGHLISVIRHSCLDTCVNVCKQEIFFPLVLFIVVLFLSSLFLTLKESTFLF